jgi:hypothetical protein
LILNQFQDGFRRNRSTNTALSEAMDFFYNSLNGKRKTVALFYDLSRAFDTVNHELITYMRIIPKNLAIDNNSLAICTGNSLIENTDNIKFLGVMIEFKLTWKGHVSMSCERIIKTCYDKMSLDKCFDKNNLWYTRIMLSYKLSYRMEFYFWGSNCDQMFKYQKRILRTMFHLHPRAACRNFFSIYGILTVPSLYILSLVLRVHVKRNASQLQDSRCTALLFKK